MAESETTNDAQRALRRKCMTLAEARKLLTGVNPHHFTTKDGSTAADRLDWTWAATMVREREYLGNPTLPADGASDGVAHAPNDAAEKRRRQRMSIERARAILGRDDPTTEAPSVNDATHDVMARQDWFFAQWLVGSTVEGKVWPDDDRQRLAEHRMGVRSGFTVEEAREITAGPDPHDDKSMDQPTEWGYELTERCLDWVRAINIVADDAAGARGMTPSKRQGDKAAAPPTNLADVPGAAEALGVELAPTVPAPHKVQGVAVPPEPPPKPKRARHVGTWMIEGRAAIAGDNCWSSWDECNTDDADPPVTSLKTAERWIRQHCEADCQYRVIIEKRIYTPTRMTKQTETVSLA